MAPWLQQWADDMYLHAHGLIPWITDYVDLEESLAVGSMAQEDLAHAAALLTATGVDPVERDRRTFARPIAEWAPANLLQRPVEDWGDTAARGFLFSEAVATVLDHVRHVADAAIAPTAVVIAAEQSLHVRHWHRWVRILSRDHRTGTTFLAALQLRASECGDLFGGTPGEDTSLEVPLDELHATWRTRVAAAALALGAGELTLPERGATRSALQAGSPLAAVITRTREVRDAHPDRRYEIYS